MWAIDVRVGRIDGIRPEGKAATPDVDVGPIRVTGQLRRSSMRRAVPLPREESSAPGVHGGAAVRVDAARRGEPQWDVAIGELGRSRNAGQHLVIVDGMASCGYDSRSGVSLLGGRRVVSKSSHEPDVYRCRGAGAHRSTGGSEHRDPCVNNEKIGDSEARFPTEQ